jgi:hypothetical protein
MANEKEGAKLNVKKVLHEPVAPYFAATYNTLLSIVQGFALGALVLTLAQHGATKITLPKAFVIWWIIALVWHRHATHVQYLAWRLGIFDTLIPLGFAVLQFLVIFSIPRSAFEFSVWVATLPLLGFLAYLNSYFHYNNPLSQTLIKEHFAEEGEQFAQDFFWEIDAYQKWAMGSMLAIFVAEAGLAGILWLDPLTEEVRTYVACGVFTVINLAISFSFDFRWSLNRSKKQSISKYPW